MLSNVATPKYYGEFRERVLSGELPVCKNIEMQMNRIDDRIANPAIYYDSNAVEGIISFCEKELTLTDGSSVHLTDTFKLWLEDIFGWYYYQTKTVIVPDPDTILGHRYETIQLKRRLVTKIFLIVGRGSAKSLFDEFIHAYGLIIDRSTTHQITTAPTMKQADEVMAPFATAIIKSRGPVFKFMTEGSIQNTTGSKALRPKLFSSKKGIENTLTNSLLEIRPMSISKLQGLRVKYATIDEWLSGDTREDVIGAIEQGASKIDDYLIVASSSEGTIRNGVGDTIKMELMSILKGEYSAPHVSIWWYRLDDISEINNVNMWIKANPNLGITVSYDTYQSEVERAENVPSARNDILAKRFGIPMEGYTFFFTYYETLPHSPKEFWGMPCSVGIDLSQGDDFCAFTFLFPLSSGDYGIKVRSYISTNKLNKLSSAARLKYQEFMDEGTVIVHDGTILNMMNVYDDIWRYIIECNYDVRACGYDPYNAKEFIDRWCKENCSFGVEKVVQGVKTESVPLGELKTLAEDRALIFDQLLMQYCMGNCVVMEDTNGNRKLLKKRYNAKIDNVSAMMDAFVAYKRNIEYFD